MKRVWGVSKFWGWGKGVNITILFWTDCGVLRAPGAQRVFQRMVKVTQDAVGVHLTDHIWEHNSTLRCPINGQLLGGLPSIRGINMASQE